MAFNLRNRSLLSVTDVSRTEFQHLIELARSLKKAKYAGTERQRLKGKNICLIFEKTSTRTRCAFEVAAYDQGAHVTYLDPSGSQIGHKESMKDTARVLGRMYDAIEYRGTKQAYVEELARYSGVPVFNGLTDEYHPTQILGDFLTMWEHSDKPLGKISYAFVGDARFNMGNSLMLAGCLMGNDVRLVAPKQLWPNQTNTKMAKALAAKSGAKLTITADIKSGVKGVDFLHTDVWVSMGEPTDVWGERIKLLSRYQVNTKMIKATANPQVKFMHCLPAFHNKETKIGKEIYDQYGLDGLEVTDDVFESERSIVFEQAENRIHTIKALMVAALGE